MYIAGKKELVMRRRIAAAVLTALMSIGVTAAITAASSTPASADDAHCC
ncbi:hypothetical protein [Microbispora sp. GKU 823]|nr:hypothetical protein [Microbispora sp. GKU 823]